MRLTLTLERAGAPALDIIATVDASATVGDLARAMAAGDPDRAVAPAGPLSLRVLSAGGAGTLLDPGAALSNAGLRSGSRVRAEQVSADLVAPGAGRGPAAAVLRVLSGPDRGKEFPLPVGTTVVGRGPEADVRLADPMVSKRHARVTIGDVVEIADLGSANGLVVEGVPLPRLPLDGSTVVALGDTSISVVPLGRPSVAASGGPAIEFVRSPRVVPPLTEVEVALPAPPRPPSPRRFPFVAMVAPLLMGAVLFLTTRNTLSLIFIALSPVIMVGTWLDATITARRQHAQGAQRFTAAVDDARAEVEGAHRVERALRLATYPSSAEVAEAVASLGPLLWCRRPEHDEYLAVRVGIGSGASVCRTTGTEVREGTTDERRAISELASAAATVDGVPIIARLRSGGALGLAGPREEAVGLARAVMLQLVGLHSPAELTVAALISPRTRPDWEWLAWLPHCGPVHSPVGPNVLADDPATGSQLLAALEELVAARSGAPGAASRPPRMRGRESGADGDVDPPNPPVVVLLVEDSVPVDRSRLTVLAEAGPDAGVYVIWVAAGVQDLPAACREFVLVGADGSGSAGFVRPGRHVHPVQVEQLDAASAGALARAMAPVEDAGAVVADESGLPQTVSFLALAGRELATSPQVQVERWRESGSLLPAAGASAGRGGSLRALVGQTAAEPMILDLRAQGPHALVGGTTGSGKSEFLQSWVLGLATAHSPQRVTFLLVDYKGGAAFADCVNLPHTVGLVTDLSPHMVRRALTSLRAELRYREHLLNRKKAKDLPALERTGDPETPPSLVIVVDEFAALATEVPEFVDGVVDVAQRGRSLGLHLILATQRPAGVIRDNLRANTNLRIALRMADVDDSNDVLGSPMAAHVDPALPGRAAVRTGPGRIVPFQSAYAGASSADVAPQVRVEIQELGFGRGARWATGEPATAGESNAESDITRVVRTVSAAADAVGLELPRKPWLPVLAPAYDLAKMRQRTDTELAVGIVDDPHHQEQRTAYFFPDVEGNLAVYGAGGSGKSVALRTLAVAAGVTPRGGPVHVFALDFGGGGLSPLEVLPHVGAVIAGDDSERVGRLLTQIRDLVDERASRYARHRSATITEYRLNSGHREEPRVLVLIDGFGAFRQEYETQVGRTALYQAFQQILLDGRAVGVHVALSADRPGTVPTAISSAVQRTIALRQADDGAYVILGAPRDVLGATSPPGRGIDLPSGLELQVAVLGGRQSLVEQSRALDRLAASIPDDPSLRPAPVRRLDEVIPAESLPVDVDGLPVLGVADDTLAPVGFAPSGTFLVSGPTSSGRSTAVLSLAGAIRRWRPTTRIHHVAGRTSPLTGLPVWTRSERQLDAIVDLAREVLVEVSVPADEGRPPVVVVIEAISDFLGTPAEAPLTEVIKQAKRNGHFVLAEADSSSWGSSWPLVVEVRSGRRGIALQPDQMDGDLLFRTAFPRVARAEFPPGRGLAVQAGKVRRVQVPLPGRAG